MEEQTQPVPQFTRTMMSDTKRQIFLNSECRSHSRARGDHHVTGIQAIVLPQQTDWQTNGEKPPGDTQSSRKPTGDTQCIRSGDETARGRTFFLEPPRRPLFQIMALWQKPMTQLSEQWGISRKEIVQLCEQYSVPRPPNGKEALELLRVKFQTFDSVGPVWAGRAAASAGEDSSEAGI